MRTIIAGSRTITDYTLVQYAVATCGWTITEVVSGTALGVDKLGERWAEENGVLCSQFPALWDTHGKRAGHLRNLRMAEYAEACIIIWDGQSPGSQSMAKYAMENGCLLYLRTHKVIVPVATEEMAMWAHYEGQQVPL